ncbi:hypothetical protein [Paraburkholderia xenovorans]|uniref:hypothetical protein n=1 Tax=Paraburkholderia xenovorans TaxID=36873 RepID=UPI0038B83C82
MQFQKAVLEQQAQLAADVEKARLAADQANTAVVNQTMQVEAKRTAGRRMRGGRSLDSVSASLG